MDAISSHRATPPMPGSTAPGLEVWAARLALLALLFLAPVAFLVGILALTSLGPSGRRCGARGPLGVLANGIVALVLVAVLAKLAAGRR